MALRLIGTATTDVNGNAVLEEGYTGTGAGEVDIVAKCTVDGSSVVSEPYPVLDCAFYDTGVQGYQDNYVNSGVTINYEDNCKVLSRTDSGNRYYLADLNHTSSSTVNDTYDFSAPCKVEFEVEAITGSPAFYCVSNATGDANEYITETGTFTKTIPSTLTGDLSIGFRIGQGASLKFKNFKIYPI